MHFDLLGPYRIGPRIGRGGMGEVYAGVNEESGERAAVKVLNPAMAQAEGFRERFEAEIESLRKLDHPNIVHLYGYGEQDGFLFYAMELIEGRSLESELSAGRRFQWREVTRIAVQVCKALKHAHDHGVIHRDLKPANLLLADDKVKLLDFGIARLFGATHLTSTGGMLGTAEYMSPEQADGRRITDRCDQYALGGVLYALLCGHPPFRAQSLPELLQLQRFAMPEPVRRYAADVPEELERIVLQLLEKEPEKRFSNANVIARRLEAMDKALSRPLPPPDDDLLLPGESPLAAAPTDQLKATRALTPPPHDASQPQTHAATAHQAVQEATIQRGPSTRFTSVEEELRQRRAQQEASHGPVLLQAAGIAGALALVLLVLWYLMKPASADALFERIQTAAGSEQPEDLIASQSHIREFLQRFPGDQRAAQIASYNEDLEVALMERRLRAQARRSGAAGELSPLERIYVEAVREAPTDPEGAARKLQALVDLYEPETELSPAQQRCLAVAGRQLNRLRERLERSVPADLQELRDRLARANDISVTDPARAIRMWQAIVALGEEKEWAAEVVAAARAAIEERGEIGRGRDGEMGR